MYNDEQNLYHYNYRKDGTEPNRNDEPVYSGNGYQTGP